MHILQPAFLVLLALAPPPFAHAQPPARSPDPASQPSGPYALQLARECDALIRLAVRRPFGWAWAQDVERAADAPEPRATPAPATRAAAVPGEAHGPPARPPRVRPDAPVVVCFDPAANPAAGLVLLRAAELLGEPRFREASVQAARGVAAAQQPGGRVPPRAVFAAAAGPHEEAPSLLPDRAPTRAALGLLLAHLDAEARAKDSKDKSGGAGPRDEVHDRLGGAARRAGQWLLKQQGDTGGWAVAWPAGAAPKDQSRVVLLETADFRDSTFAALLAAAVLDDPRQKASAEKSADFLLRLRLDASARFGAGLWASAYNLDATVCERFPEFPPAVDALATRHALQTLLACHLVIDHGGADRALLTSSKVAGNLPRRDGAWSRLYDPFYGFEGPPAPRPAAAGDLFGAGPATQPLTGYRTPGTWGLPPVLDAARRVHDLGADAYLRRLAGGYDYRQHLAHALCGLDDDALTFDLPAAAEDVPAYLQRHESEWPLLQGQPPADLPARVHRLWLLLARARAEQFQAAAP